MKPKVRKQYQGREDAIVERVAKAIDGDATDLIDELEGMASIAKTMTDHEDPAVALALTMIADLAATLNALIAMKFFPGSWDNEIEHQE